MPPICLDSDRIPIRRALLIAIRYSAERDGVVRLRLTHRDVRRLRARLVSEGYLEKNIVVLCDNSRLAPHLQPTKANIVREIKALVQDVQPGDRLVFYYAGHGYQLVSQQASEEDGLDEALLPSDHLGEPFDADGYPLHSYKEYRDQPQYRKIIDRLLIDDELRKLLVDPLPAGAHLTAIFDACHSKTMLDLSHYDCNSMWFPWCTKFRGYARSHLLPLRRRNACFTEGTMAEQVARSETRAPKRRPTPINTNLRSRTGSMSYNGSNGSHSTPWSLQNVLDADTTLCLSPKSDSECSGWCKPQSGPGVVDILSLSSTTDGDLAWDGEKNESMTSTLLDILDQCPGIALGPLVQELGHRIRAYCMKLHEHWTQQQKLKFDVTRKHQSLKDGESYEDDPMNLQTPHLGGMNRLNLQDTFTF